MAPRLGIVDVVEAEQQQRAEAADLVVDLVQAPGHRGRRAHQPVVLGAVFRRDVGVRHIGAVLEELGELKEREQRQKILAHHAAHHPARGQPHRLRVGIRDEHLAHEPPVRALGRAAGAGRADLDRLPVAADVGRVEVQAHRPEAALPRELERIRALADAGHADRRMRLLQRHDVRSQRAQHQVGLGHFPVFAGVVERLLLGPQFQDYLERLARHLAVLPGIAVDVEQRPVTRQSARGHAEVEAALGDVVEHRDAIGELGGMVVRHQEAAGADAHALRLHERLGHEQIGRRVRLPRRGVVLADPRLAESELVRPAQLLQIPLVSVVEAALGRMRRHREQSIVHGNPQA